MPKPVLERLQDWYLAQCDEDWEHSYGVKIDTLDNPGWLLDVDLKDTSLEFRPFEKVHIQRSDEHDWVRCKIEDAKFSGACGPKNLEEMLCCFLDWAELSA
jgi:hypothetical protein